MHILAWLNRNARTGAICRGLFAEDEYQAVNSFFERRNIQPTPLVSLRGLAARLGLADLLLKDESNRLSLNAFKILGVTYALARLVANENSEPGTRLVCASTGNHGRAVASEGRRLGLNVTVYLPRGTLQSRIAAIQRERANVVLIDGSYDETVEEAAHDAARSGAWFISDTARPGYEQVPRWIMAGYTWMMEEARSQWAPDPLPDVVLVQAGVGGLACAVLSWLAHRYGAGRPYTIVCEPLDAACCLESARAGQPVVLLGDMPTVMAGLRAGRMSSIVWPAIAIADAFVAIDDEATFAAMNLLAHPRDGDSPVVAGPSGACSLAALRAIIEDDAASSVRAAANLTAASRVLVINTEGATHVAGP